MVIDITNLIVKHKDMITTDINEIKTHLSSYLTKVGKGETVIICKRNIPIAELRPIVEKPRRKRPVGLAGKTYPGFKISDAFFEPLPDVLTNAFSGQDS